VHVAQAAAGFLQVRFEQEGQFAEEPGPLVVQFAQLGQPGPGRGPPVLQRPLAQLHGQAGVTGHVPGVEQPERDLEVGPRHPAGLGHGPDRVIQARARVPDRIPDPVGDAGDPVPPGVQQQHVQVTAGQQFPAAVSPHRHQGDPGFGAEQARQPPVGFRAPAGTIGRERRHQGHWVPRSPFPGSRALPLPGSPAGP
jgi:hypothetical protein